MVTCVARKLRALNKAGHSAALAVRNERAQFNFDFVLQTHFQAADGAGQVGHQALVNFGAGVNAARGSTVLPRVVITKITHTGYHFCQVSVVKNNHRGFATQFEVRALERACSCLQNAPAKCWRNGQS